MILLLSIVTPLVYKAVTRFLPLCFIVKSSPKYARSFMLVQAAFWIIIGDLSAENYCVGLDYY